MIWFVQCEPLIKIIPCFIDLGLYWVKLSYKFNGGELDPQFATPQVCAYMTTIATSYFLLFGRMYYYLLRLLCCLIFSFCFWCMIRSQNYKQAMCTLQQMPLPKGSRLYHWMIQESFPEPLQTGLVVFRSNVSANVQIKLLVKVTRLN